VKKDIRFIGLDVHAETIAVAVAEASGEVRSLGVIPNRPESVKRLVKKLGPTGSLRICYEAGPCGYVLYWQLTELGVHCDVVAPTLVPVKAGDRIKTDRRDALKLARSYRSGDLTPVWVPDAEHEALRDLVRAREAAKKDQLRAIGCRSFCCGADCERRRRSRRGPRSISPGRRRCGSNKPRWPRRYSTTSPRSSTRTSASSGWSGPSTRPSRPRRRPSGPSSKGCKHCAASRASRRPPSWPSSVRSVASAGRSS